MQPLELWGGVECTVNRVGDRFHDQVARSGLRPAVDEAERIASTGARAVRFPCLWEHAQRDSEDAFDWRFVDERLPPLRERGVRIIAGLLHHGSGPHFTSLVDRRFPMLLARYARAFAERFPWIEAYTPVNEPLTTARFSGLYGHWYPHKRDRRAFVRALLNQIEGTARAMEAIREVNPRAKLIQTEDRATVSSTPALEEVARFDGERTWLTFDLLCGRVDRTHPLHRFLVDSGISEATLAGLVDKPCPPDVLGINHYTTSDRFLDERLDRYPADVHGGNGRLRYVDVARGSVRAPRGHQAHIEETWARYRRPIAITEVHLDAPRDEQLRWLWEAWQSAQRARALGVDIRAVTSWALFGSLDWNSLCRRLDGYYEPGAFDARTDPPRPTAIAKLMHELSTTGTSTHPVLSIVGKWHREHMASNDPPPPFVRGRPRPILVVGAGGVLGRAIVRTLTSRRLPCAALLRSALDIAERSQVDAALAAWDPWAVINAAGYVRVDDAEQSVEECRRSNVDGARTLALACQARGIRLLTFSSDLVFSGAKGDVYLEDDPVDPLGVYGASQADAERAVLALQSDALIVRTSAFFGSDDGSDFVARATATVRAGERFQAANDVVVSPTYVPQLVDATLDLLVDGERGVVHLAGTSQIDWASLARSAVERVGLNAELVEPVPHDELGWRARRPAFSALGSTRTAVMTSLPEALDRMAREGPPSS